MVEIECISQTPRFCEEKHYFGLERNKRIHSNFQVVEPKGYMIDFIGISKGGSGCTCTPPSSSNIAVTNKSLKLKTMLKNDE